MPLRVDPEMIAAMEARRSAPPAPQYPEDDVETVRAFANARYSAMARRLPQHPEVQVEEIDAAGVPARLYTPPGAPEGAGLVVYLHGGGMWRCSLDTHDPVVRRYAAESGTRFLSVDYRMSPEHPYPQSQEDGYTALSWAVEHADELGIDPRRLAIAGDSAGGGLAAGVALMARDRGEIQLALQVLIYPMLDDRTGFDTELAPYATWTYEDNAVGWRMLLGEAAGTDAVAAYAAPARAEYLIGLAPAYVEVGVLDIYRDEDIDYARRLASAGVPLELHVHDGVTHAFEMINPRAAVSERAWADRARVFATLAEPVARPEEPEEREEQERPEESPAGAASVDQAESGEGGDASDAVDSEAVGADAEDSLEPESDADDSPEPESEGEAESAETEPAEPESADAEPEHEPEPDAEPERDAEAEHQSEPDAEAEHELDAEHEAEHEREPDAEAKHEPDDDRESDAAAPESDAERESVAAEDEKPSATP